MTQTPGGFNQEAGPGAQPQPGATIENEGVHQITAADVIRQEKCDEKIVLLTPDQDSFVKSSIKAIQTAIENMTKKLINFFSQFKVMLMLFLIKFKI